MIAFEINKTYQMRFIGDSELIVPVKILKRTAKSVRIELNGNQKTCRIKEWGESEYILPEGSYSMAPSCRAEKPL